MKKILIALVFLSGMSAVAATVKAGAKNKMDRKISCIEECPCDLTPEEKEIIALGRAQIKAGSGTEPNAHMAKKMQDQFIEVSEEEQKERSEIDRSIQSLSLDQLKALKKYIQKLSK